MVERTLNESRPWARAPALVSSTVTGSTLLGHVFPGENEGSAGGKL